jgi:hypothetical protein
MLGFHKLISALVGLGSLLVFAAEVPNPIYQGKRLSQWFDEFAVAPAYVTPATLAIQRLGPDAVPYLVQFLRPSETNSWKKRAALSALGTLGEKGSASVPVLIRCLNDGDLKAQADAAYTLAKLGAHAKDAIRPLQDYLRKNSAPYNGLAAATALWEIDPHQTPLIVPALINMLMSAGLFEFDAHVIELLAEIGSAAHQAIPILQLGLKGVQQEDREPIQEAIKKIQVKKMDEPGGPANGSQSIRSETNRTSSAAGSRR